ncbi:MAG TPA: nitrilase-related carbon-nitrogen hydrolase [Spirochaetia bacterium]|nr:nitrilase-related carbon-nitrogen hydrolase [Spirochaetia bacterium]
MNVGYLQTSPVFGMKERNFEEVAGMVDAYTGARPIDLLVLPELFSTGYTFVSPEEAASLAEPADGPTAEFLRTIAAKTGGVVVAGFAERDGTRIYNSSLIVNAADRIGTYRKVQLFNKENLFFTPGDRAPEVYRFDDFTLGVMICFDWFFPETMRLLMLDGADIVAHPSNLVLPYCQEAMKTRCLENCMFSVTANRIGREARGEDRFYFTGASQITGPEGSALATAPAKEPFLEVVRIDPAAARNKKINPYNDLAANRRVDLYSKLVMRAPATTSEEQ